MNPLSRERVRVGVVRVRVRVRDRVRLLRYADVPSYDSITDSLYTGVHFALPVRRCPHVETVDRPELIVQNDWLRFVFGSIVSTCLSTTPKPWG